MQLETKLPEIEKRCAFDGHPFEGVIYQYVEAVDHATSRKMLHHLQFCSKACTRRYIRKFCFLDPKIIVFTEIYFRETFPEDEEQILIAPDIGALACYNRAGKGLTIQEFRNTSQSQKWIEHARHLHLDKGIFLQGEQISTAFAGFQEVNVENHMQKEGSYLRVSTTDVDVEECKKPRPKKQKKNKEDIESI
jgi:hypothetical protein